jgi:isoleucyl-tRNA synthetase
VRAALDTFDAAAATRAIEAFVDDVSNWYIRRNRRRFWKGELDADKQAAYATLYRVLTETARLAAPFIPHLSDAMWHNLVAAALPNQPDSVHLADYPVAEPGTRHIDIERAVDLARRTVAAGRTARAAAAIRTRQPLPVARIKLPVAAGGRLSGDATLEAELEAEIREELNVKSLEFISDDSALVERVLYPLLPIIGPRHGAAVGRVMAAARSGEWELLADGSANAGGVTLAADEFEITARPRAGQEVAADGDLLVALDTELDETLVAEGHAREIGHRLQNLRKAAGLEISDRIVAVISGDRAVLDALADHTDWLAAEILAIRLELRADGQLDEPLASEEVEIGDGVVRLELARSE